MLTLLQAGTIFFRISQQIVLFGGFCLAAWLARPFSGAARTRQRLQRAQAVCFTDTFRHLGATWIKIGQVLSARPDLLPPHVIAELQTLQDDVPAESFEKIQSVIEEDLAATLESRFSTFDRVPVAAASVAQVYRATLPTGEAVAVKVQRPGIRARMQRDLNVMKIAAGLADLLPGVNNLSLPKMAAEFARAIEMQLDFPREMTNNRRFAENFGATPYIRVPELFGSHSGGRVITMAWADGVRFRDAIVNPPLPRGVLGERLIDLYFAMGFRDKFVHADLHPGNLMVDADGNYILLDTGLVYEVPPHYVRKFIRVLTAATVFDGRMMAEAYLEGNDVPDKRLAAIYADADTLMDRYRGKSYSDMEMSEATLAIFALLRKHRIYVDAEWTCFILSEVTFEGIAKMMDADVDIMNLFIQKLPHFLAQSGVVDQADPLVDKAADFARSTGG